MAFSVKRALDVWWGRDGNAYPDGDGFGPTSVPLGYDFNFRTWGTIAVGGEVISTPAGNYASLLVTATAASAVVLGYRLVKRKPSTSLFSAKY